ncbi:MAG: polyhydroxyalkanoate synthesis regulator DNA-binding domain-containing protein [Thermodesulfobacteriota bacterium]
MRRIKKYGNRKLYDTTDKKYISLSRVSELVMSGEEVYIVDAKTGEDLTSATISQLLARERHVPPGVLMQLLQKGQGTVSGTIQYARKYVSLWQSAFSMAEGEFDRLVSRMIKNNEISETEGSRVKTDMQGFAGNMKSWLSEKVDQRVSEVLSMMNLVTREQMSALKAENRELARRVEDLERLLSEDKALDAQQENRPRKAAAVS